MFLTVVGALNQGFLQTLKLFIVTLLGAIPLGLVISFGSMSRFTPLRWLTRGIIWVIRGTPLMLQLIILYYIPGKLMGYSPWGTGETGRFWLQPLPLLSITPAIFPRSTGAGSRGSRWGSRRRDWCWGSPGGRSFLRSLCCR